MGICDKKNYSQYTVIYCNIGAMLKLNIDSEGEGVLPSEKYRIDVIRARPRTISRDKYLKDFVTTPDDVKLIPKIKKQRPKQKDQSYDDENVYIPKSARVAQEQRHLEEILTPGLWTMTHNYKMMRMVSTRMLAIATARTTRVLRENGMGMKSCH